MNMKQVNWKVDGMTCSNCALTVQQYLTSAGMENVQVNLMGGEVSFDINGKNEQQIVKGIESLGYSVQTNGTTTGHKPKRIFSNHKQRFLFCLVFTLPLMLHMFDKWVHFHWLMNPWVQLGLCLPVYVVGMDFFGRSAFKSIRNRMPNICLLYTSPSPRD